MSTLLEHVEAFLATHGMADSRFGLEAAGDKNLVRDLRKGRRLWPETEGKVRQFMVTYRPESAAA